MTIIDGSSGEGGGQILRTSLALSLVTGQPFRIARIRAGRKSPGLLRQHLTAVNAAAEIADAEVSGATMGSRELTFSPGPIRAGHYKFEIGTAGSATLVLQTILPALVVAGASSELMLGGGTHNPFAPPFDFLARAFLPLLGRMGARVEARLERPGFYPAGGGKFRVQIQPAARLEPLNLLSRGEVRARRATAMVANLPHRIAERELSLIGNKMSWPPDWLTTQVVDNSKGPGNVVMIDI